MDLYIVRKKLSMGIPLTKIHLRVTYYSRVSTDSKEQKKSLKNQVEHFDKFIKSNPNWTYVNGYVDDGITGTSDIKRNNFMRMIEDARSGKFDLIITKEISRFSRNTLDSIKYTRELLSYGVAVLFLNDNINTALSDSELRLTIMASMAQDEIRRLSERVKFGMNRAIERGEILGNDMLYGYKKDKNSGVLNIIEDEAIVVRRIYNLYVIDDLSLSKICKKLNEENIKTKEGKLWNVSTVSRMIENPKYKGFYCGRKTEIVDYMQKKVKYIKKNDWIIYEDKKRIPPIVNDYVWEKANKKLILRKKINTKNIYKNRYLYSSKIYCKKHNTIFHRRYFRRDKKDVTWLCKEYLIKGKCFCDSPNIRESELDFIFYDLIKKLNINKEKIISNLVKYYKSVNIDNDFDVVENSIRKENDEILIKKDKLLELNLSGNLSNEEFYLKNNLFNERLKVLKERLEKLQLDKKISVNLDKKKNLYNSLKSKINSKNVSDKIIELLLDHIEVSKCKNNIILDVLLSYKSDEQKIFFTNKYIFKRGYDTRSTKRYTVTYLVNCFTSSF